MNLHCDFVQDYAVQNKLIVLWDNKGRCFMYLRWHRLNVLNSFTQFWYYVDTLILYDDLCVFHGLLQLYQLM